MASYEAQLKGYYLVVTTLGNLAGTLRIGMRMPKYPLWVFMGVLTQLSRYTIEQPSEYPFPWLAAYALSTAMLLGVGARKILRAPRSAHSSSSAGAERSSAFTSSVARGAASGISIIICGSVARGRRKQLGAIPEGCASASEGISGVPGAAGALRPGATYQLR